MLDSILIQFEERFNQPDLDVLQKLEETLLTGEVKDSADQYPELNRDRLKVQLAMFRSKYTNPVLKRFDSWSERLVWSSWIPCQAALFIPVSSAEA